MLSFSIAFLMATSLGFLAGMGIGGGSLLLLWLTQVVKMEQSQARLLNLLFYLPAALVSTLLRRNHKQIQIETALPGMVTGCITAFVFSILTQKLDVSFLRKLLGGLLVLTGMREIFYRRRKAK